LEILKKYYKAYFVAEKIQTKIKLLIFMKKIIIALMFLLSVLYSTNTFAQETQSNDTIQATLEKIQSDLSLLKNLKITGYIQAQSVFTDSVNGFGNNYDKKFQVRRGRLKFTYSSNPLSQYVIQVDITEGGVGIKDAYAKFTEPFFKALTLTTGLFNRPFGYEIEYSSSNRESPERSLFTTTLMQKERDLGAMLTLQAPKTSRWNFIKLDLALVAGNGLVAETDKYKDFIGRINLSKSFMNEKLKLSGGISYYYGGPNNPNATWAGNWTDGGVKYFATTTTDKNHRNVREITGLDFQASLDNALGMTTLRGEYVFGRQAGTLASSASPTVALSATDVAATRPTSGYYVYFIQNLGQSRHSVVVKYDVYDPNTAVSGTEITKAKGFSKADIKYSTLGLGYAIRLDSNIKMTFYYDKVTNENTGISGFTKDLKDNLFTIRLQYKF
jgi:hypothetical protein